MHNFITERERERKCVRACVLAALILIAYSTGIILLIDILNKYKNGIEYLRVNILLVYYIGRFCVNLNYLAYLK
jgi:hypothetical protein